MNILLFVGLGQKVCVFFPLINTWIAMKLREQFLALSLQKKTEIVCEELFGDIDFMCMF